MKISAAEAQWNDCQKCGFSLFQIGGFSQSDPTPSFSIEVPGLLSYLSTGSFNGKVTGLNELNQQYVAKYGKGNYLPPVGAIYWSMRGMAYAGSFVALVALVGAFLLWKRRLERLKWFLWIAVASTFLPFIACAFGWCLTEIGRQPWIVQGLLKTSNANSPAVSSTWLGISLGVFVSLYIALFVLDLWLMRRYADRDPSDPGEELGGPAPAIGY
jgi:cytochrome d ubiquinol oxidase subunit I